VRRNVSEGNLRYGLHFMYSDDCHYIGNVFRRNLAGVAVMYTKRVEMVENRFEDNWGSASYGLLLKEIADARIERNRFHRNTVGLLADGAARIVAADNEFVANGWAVKLMASTYDGRFERNEFVGNTFDVASNSGESSNRFAGNYFDAYRGYDLDRDGFGDVPHRPVRLFSVLVEQNAPAVILLRSLFVDLLDAAERVLPVLTPRTLVDERPAMRRLQRQVVRP
jgi:nitrous oxidase accessory protein